MLCALQECSECALFIVQVCVCVLALMWSDCWNDKGWVEASLPSTRSCWHSSVVSWLQRVRRVRKWHACCCCYHSGFVWCRMYSASGFVVVVVVAIAVCRFGFRHFFVPMKATKLQHSGCGCGRQAVSQSLSQLGSALVRQTCWGFIEMHSCCWFSQLPPQPQVSNNQQQMQ